MAEDRKHALRHAIRSCRRCQPPSEDWDSLFDDTDFKITDGLDHHKKFKHPDGISVNCGMRDLRCLV